MSLWTSSVITLFLLQTAQFQPQKVNDDSKPLAVEEVAGSSEDVPHPLVLAKKDWSLTRAYFDVFQILSNRNTCSSFYGGPRAATTVLNDFVTRIETRSLVREVSFKMGGTPVVFSDPAHGVLYRLFATTTVNIHGSFYQRRADPMRKLPEDVGSFAPGTRPARALILLHELGHLIEGENGTWLIPDDGYDVLQSRANTLRVQQACYSQLKELK